MTTYLDDWLTLKRKKAKEMHEKLGPNVDWKNPEQVNEYYNYYHRDEIIRQLLEELAAEHWIKVKLESTLPKPEDFFKKMYSKLKPEEWEDVFKKT